MNTKRILLLVILSATFLQCRKLKKVVTKKSETFNDETNNFILQKRLHKLKEYSQKATKRLAALSDYSNFYNKYLTEILRSRVPGTVGHARVKNFIIRKLQEYNWDVKTQNFTMWTPLGPKNFTNIIGTLNPRADRVLALAAHYDSKILPVVNGKFFTAATDSAVPCAMLLDFARDLSDKAKEITSTLEQVSPQLLFLDGEEAFVEWTKTDSIYGSRYMAASMSNASHWNPKLALHEISQLDSMDAFVLLDLLGAKDPTFYNWFPTTSRLYESLKKIEKNLRAEGQLFGVNHKHYSGHYFTGQRPEDIGIYGKIDDDHVPFMQKGVPILHIIPYPFPSTWHTLNDDEEHLDPTTIEDLLKIFRHFIFSYFSLE
ncbi:glutaminyl-peptide cyclotransferase-like [Clytia hemisphaerica]|uniref:Glutaminyl-peptide cyclotransferase n=1 Tax=Clytia hemisphaerica TaxID=252671 RepID=A0A7M5UDB3_9CNID